MGANTKKGRGSFSKKFIALYYTRSDAETGNHYRRRDWRVGYGLPASEGWLSGNRNGKE